MYLFTYKGEFQPFNQGGVKLKILCKDEFIVLTDEQKLDFYNEDNLCSKK